MRTSRSPLAPRPLALLLGLALVAPGATARPQDPPAAEAAAPTEDELTDERLWEAWGYLLPEEQREIVEWFRLEASFLDNFQTQLVAYLLSTQDRDPGTWPDIEEAPFFDPTVHAPAQPIERRRLTVRNPHVKEVTEAILGGRAEPFLDSAWEYDWGSRELRVHRERLDEPERMFSNALQGFAPDLDLAEALLVRMLDRGDEAETLAAFAHAYTNRSGGVYPGITLYDAWSSGETLEMPDVDVLGLIHTLDDDWKTWVAPVPAPQQKSLYAQAGAHFVPARRYRSLRETLAAVYLRGGRVSEGMYGGYLMRFHALWEKYSSTPTQLAEDLPDGAGWEGFLNLVIEGYEADAELQGQAATRMAWLDHGRNQVRGRLVWVLREFGALDRTEKPAPEPDPEPDPGPNPPEEEPTQLVLSLGMDSSATPADEEDPLAGHEDLLKRLAKLKGAERDALLDAIDTALGEAELPQLALVRQLLDGAAPRGELPEATEFGPHDPDVWGGGKARRKTRAGTSRWKKVAQEAGLTELPAPAFEGTVHYEWGSGTIVRREEEKEDRGWAFRNLLRGLPPHADYARALLLAELDAAGRHRAEAEFFSHNYADLKAYWYEQIELYDLWSRQVPNDVPDVDVIAFAKKVLSESVTPPIPKQQHGTWYPRIYDSASAYSKFRRRAETVAAVWLEAEPQVEPGFENTLNYLHALAVHVEQDIGPARERLEEHGVGFFEAVLTEMNGIPNAYGEAGKRQASLRAGADEIRAITLRVLAENGYE